MSRCLTARKPTKRRRRAAGKERQPMSEKEWAVTVTALATATVYIKAETSEDASEDAELLGFDGLDASDMQFDNFMAGEAKEAD